MRIPHLQDPASPTGARAQSASDSAPRLKATVDDGSIRATAILLTQQGLADALQDGRDWAEAAPLTLVETERGVLTLWALVKEVVARPQAEAALASLLSQALSLRLRGVAEGLALLGRQALEPKAPSPSPSPVG